MTDTTNNPLLDFSGLARFDLIKPEHVPPAIDHLIAQSSAVVAQLEAPTEGGDGAVTWDNFVAPLESATELLGRAWSIVSHLNNVVDTPELRAAYNDNQPKVTEFWTALAQNEALFGKYKALRDSSAFASLAPARQRIIDNAVRDFRMGGAELPEDQKARFAAIQEEQASVSTRFSENVLDATNDYKLTVEDEADLAGLPDDAKHAARALAEKEGKQGWMFSLHFPSYYPILQFADNRALRETIYRANATKASEQGAMFSQRDNWDNTGNIVTLLKLRAEEATLLGYKNFAEVSLVPKMAQSPAHVISFLEDLAQRARPYAEKDYAELRAFAQDELGLAELQAWDLPYASEKLQERRYAFFRARSKAVFPGTQSHRWLVPPDPVAVCRHHRAGRGAHLASRCALLPHRARWQIDRPVLPRPVCPRRQERRRVDG